MKPERFGELVAALWRVIEAEEPEAIEMAMREFRGSVFMAIMPKWNQEAARESATGGVTERGALELAEADLQDRFRLLRLYQDSVRRERERLVRSNKFDGTGKEIMSNQLRNWKGTVVALNLATGERERMSLDANFELAVDGGQVVRNFITELQNKGFTNLYWESLTSTE
jgi:hypothetical protein